MQKRTIKIYLADGEPDGIREAQIAMSTIQAIAFRRLQLRNVCDMFSTEMSRPGVYLLLGPDENEPDRYVAYVGESENVASRLQDHVSRGAKGFWTETIVLVSKDENLTKSHARYAEARLIAEVATGPRWSLHNSQRASEQGKLPYSERAMMEEFIEQAKVLVGCLGHDLFKAVSPSLPAEPAASQSDARLKEIIFGYRKGAEYDAQMMITEGGEYVVLKGSLARHVPLPSAANWILGLRDAMQKVGVLVVDGNTLRFERDMVFASPTAAAGAVSGSNINGRAVWRLSDGTTLAAWEQGQEFGANNSQT